MAFNNFIIRLTSEARPLLGDDPTVIEFGNQTFSARGDSLRMLREFLAKNQIAHDAEAINTLETRYNKGDLDRLTQLYYEALGFVSYDAIDVNSLHGSLIMDLNYNLRDKYKFKRTFDLVTNSGTGEHIFDQSSIFQNVHEMTRKGGLMIHCLPCNNYINHGFYSFSPLLFMDLAEINDYDILKISVGSSSGYETGYVSDQMPARYDLGGAELSLDDLQKRVADRRVRRYLIALVAKFLGIKKGKGPYPLEPAIRSVSRQQSMSLVSAVLRKRTDEAFRKPIQGRYGGANIESDQLREDYTAD